jgi:hypothetical protein
MKSILSIITLTFLIALGSCKNNQKEISQSNDEISNIAIGTISEEKSSNKAGILNESPPALCEPPLEKDQLKIPTKIIKNAFMTMELSNYNKDKQAIIALVTKCGGFISNERETNNNYSINNVLIIKIPAEKFDGTSEGIENIGKKIDSKEITLEDVTAQYIDNASRLKTKKEVLNRYMEILKKANNIDDILAVENELRTIQEEIESTEAILSQLDNQVAYSTLTLTLYKETGYVASKKSFFSEIGDSISNGWHGLLSVLIGLISLWPLFIFISILVVFCYKMIVRNRAKSIVKK